MALTKFGSTPPPKRVYKKRQDRGKHVHVYLYPIDKAKLDALCTVTGFQASAVVRMALCVLDLMLADGRLDKSALIATHRMPGQGGGKG